jgi:hypothetical protein
MPLGPGQLFLDPGQLQPEQIGRQLAHLVGVALGKRITPYPASAGSIAGRFQPGIWTAGAGPVAVSTPYGLTNTLSAVRSSIVR